MRDPDWNQLAILNILELWINTNYLKGNLWSEDTKHVRREPRYALLTKWRHGPNPLSLSCRHGPRMKELGLVILTFFRCSVESTEKNLKVLIVLERSRRHKAFCSCAQRIIHKVDHRYLFKGLYKECSRMIM